MGGCKMGGVADGGRKGGVVTRRFKDMTLPILGFGCMRLPLKGDEIDMKELERMVECAFAGGVNYFDTAYMYMGGKSENAIGKVLSNYKRESFYIADKNPARMLSSKADVHRIFDEQLKKCGVDYFDFYLVHNINESSFENYRKYDMFNELSKYKKDGRIRNLGFSFHGNTSMLKEVAFEHPWDFCQLQINYLDWNVMNARPHYEIAVKAKLPVIVMEPIRGGGLCNLSDKTAALLKNSCPGQTPASFALRWVAGRDNVVVALSGMSNLEQMRMNIETFSDYKPITPGEEKVAAQMASMIQSNGEINCTACRYCTEGCPRGVNIPAIFSIYNSYKASKSPWSLSYYDSLDDSEKADKCVSCGICIKHCPQTLNIPELLKKVDSEIKAVKAKS